jgi:hypothetical protein
MKGEIPGYKMTLIASADLSAKRYKAIKIDSDGKAAIAGDGQSAVGILQNTPVAGEAATIMTSGISFVEYGDTVTAGSNLASDADGNLVVAGASDAILGVALCDGADGDIGTMLLVSGASSGTTGIAKSYSQICIPVELDEMDDLEVITDFIPGYAGKIEKLSFIVGTPVTTEGKSATFSMDVEATGVTGGSLALTSVNCATRGAVVEASNITAGNAFTATQKISLKVANTAAAFAEGSGVLVVTLSH